MTQLLPKQVNFKRYIGPVTTSSHRPTRLDKTVVSRRVGGVNWALVLHVYNSTRRLTRYFGAIINTTIHHNNTAINYTAIPAVAV